jgi:hypothetical protein
MPESYSRVCPADRLCESACILNAHSEPVSQIRRYAFFRRKLSTFSIDLVNGVIMSKKKVVYADPTKKKFVVTLERDGTHCVLMHNQDWGLELRGRKNPPGAELRIKNGVEVRIKKNK